MTDLEKPTAEIANDVNNKPVLQELDATQQANAVGYTEYLEALDLDVSDKEMKRLRWKLDLIILPIFLVTQALQFMDKTSLNYANLFGYQEALGLKGQQFNYLSAMIYAGYFFGQYPCGWLIGRFPAQKVMAVSVMLWGLMVILMTQARDYPSALGVGSYISMGVSKLPVDLTPERWELIFYILGGVTCLWAFVIWFLLSDSPANASFLNHRERLIAVKRVAGNETGIKNKSFDKSQIKAGFMDPKTLLIFTSVFAAAIPNGVVNSFSTIIIRDMGFSTTKTTQLKSVGDAVQIIALLIGGTVILNVPNSRLATATVANILCTVAAASMAYLPRSNTWGRLVCFWLVNSQSVGFTVSLTTISSNMAGYTHRSLASAMVFTAYCWGNFAGPFVVKPEEAPHFKGATIGLLVGYAIKLGCHLGLLVYMFSVNRYRNKTYGPANKEASDEAGMRDQTEFENKNFRYATPEEAQRNIGPMMLHQGLSSVLAKAPSDVVILSSLRTPICRSNRGQLRDAYPEQLLSVVLRATLDAKPNLPPAPIEDVAVGVVLSELGGSKAARMAMNHVGYPNTTSLCTFNRACSSSFQSIALIAAQIRTGAISIGIGAGMESMTRNYGSRAIPTDLWPNIEQSPVKDALDCIMPMGITSENVAERHHISREDQDAFAVRSHLRAAKARDSGFFRN
ncbi:hypothetical protein ACJ41O_007283 [Fusarium nematophilum]